MRSGRPLRTFLRILALMNAVASCLVSCNNNEITITIKQQQHEEEATYSTTSKGNTGTSPSSPCPLVNGLNERLNVFEIAYRENRATLCSAGIRDYLIKDDQISSSSYHNSNGEYAPKHGRLHSTTGATAWCAIKAETDKWIQVDLQMDKVVYGVVTQGRISYEQWVTLFQIQHKSTGSNDFQYVTDSSNKPEV